MTEKVSDPKLMNYINFESIFLPDIKGEKLLCKILTLLPDISITIRPIKGFAVVTTAMSIKLLQKTQTNNTKKFATGFLTLDQESRVVPLDQSDPKVKVYTLIGIWVSGLEIDSSYIPAEDKVQRLIQQEDHKAKSLNDPRVLEAILRFIFCNDIKSRMSPPPKPYEKNSASFLLVNFSNPLPQFLEFMSIGLACLSIP